MELEQGARPVMTLDGIKKAVASQDRRDKTGEVTCFATIVRLPRSQMEWLIELAARAEESEMKGSK